jgi:hypothetical protein
MNPREAQRRIFDITEEVLEKQKETATKALDTVRTIRNMLGVDNTTKEPLK